MSPRKKHASKSSAGPPDAPAAQGERLQKVLAAAGVASRRECEKLIEEGRVMVDGQIVTRLGTKADPSRQEIAVDGQKLKPPKHVYYAVYKPPGVVSTNRDPSGRTRLVDLAPDEKRLFCVGRLDRSSEGLALLTNDGDLAHRIMHPKFGVAKTYVVEVAGKFTAEDARKLQDGVYLSEGKAKANRVKIKSSRGKSTLLEIELREGKNREIRRIMAKLEHKVLNLKRIAIGSLRLGDMPEGSYRILSRQEIAGLRRGSSSAKATSGGKPSAGKRKKKAATESLPPADEGDWDDDDFGDELIEIRDEPPRKRSGGGAVIGGDAPSGPRRKKAASRGRGRPAKASAKQKPRGKSVRKKASRGGKPKRKRSR